MCDLQVARPARQPHDNGAGMVCSARLQDSPAVGCCPTDWLIKCGATEDRGAGAKHQEGSRTTLVLAWWAGGRRPAPGPPGSGPARSPPWRQPPSPQQPPAGTAEPTPDPSVQPAEPAPPQPLDAAACSMLESAVQPADRQPTWPASFSWPEVGISSAQDLGDAGPMRASATSPQHASPAWVAVQGADAGSGAVAAVHRRKRARHAQEERLLLPPLRFFLTSETEIREVYGA